MSVCLMAFHKAISYHSFALCHPYHCPPLCFQDPMGSIGSRTLPPLNGSISSPIIPARTLPALHSTPPPDNNTSSTSPDNPLNRSMLPPLKKEGRMIINSLLLYPPLQRSWKGGMLVSPCPSVCLSVCGLKRVRSVSSKILIGSISYMHIL